MHSLLPTLISLSTANKTICPSGPDRPDGSQEQKTKMITNNTNKSIMKKSLIFAATAAVVLSACAKVDTYKVSEQEAVSFGVYAGRAATKAVSGTDYGTVTTASLKDAASKGFGVFGYYTDAAPYASNTKANFMYNQQVTWDGTSAWTYSPVKYWPNEHGASATSTDTDKLTFLAYAPFVENLSAANGTVKDGAATAATEGITAMTKNTEEKDAILTFVVPASAEEQIDLLYGVMKAPYTDVEGTPIGVANKPLENLTKQKTDGKVEILFKHSLAKIAIDIKEVVDAVDPTTHVNPASDGTKVVVKSLKLKGTNIGTKGELNLYTAAWNVTTTATEFTVDPLPATISVDAVPTKYSEIPAGVDEDGLDKTIDLMLVPYYSDNGTDADDTDDVFTQISGVEIVYYVCTEDSQLDGGVSVVEDKISKDFTTPLAIAMGKQYNLNVLLGLTSVDLTATVEAWDVTTPDTNVDLPKNK